MRGPLILFSLILLSLVLIGCATNSAVLAPTIQTDTLSRSPVTEGAQYQCWVSGKLAWDAVKENLKFIPQRTSQAHFDVWPLLNPPHCYNCVTINVVYHDKVQKLLDVDVTLFNPLGLPGWFVRGIVDTPDGSEVNLFNPDRWWHSADQLPDDDPAPFKAYATDNTDWAFGPGESHTETYEFQYWELGEFAECTYRVVARFPQEPGEPTSITCAADPMTFTNLGGFLTMRAEVEADSTSPPYAVEGRIRYYGEPSPGDWWSLRPESGNTYIGWYMGQETDAHMAVRWTAARMEGAGENYLALRRFSYVSHDPPTPTREFPQVGSSVGVFVDQLTTQMTEAQKEFMATHCVGSQKLVKDLADSMRVYSDDFIVLQYHLAFGAGDISNIHGNDWIKNWDFENAQEDFFEHRSWSTQPNQRVLQLDWNWHLTDPTSDWVLYFIGNTLERMDPLGDQFDGVFADSASQPWNTDPPKWWDGSDDPHDMFTYWTPKTQSFFDTVVQAYHTLPTYYYLIPNAGSYVTTISDITYDQCDGVMIEGFAHWGPENYFTEEDWRLQMNRIRSLAIQDKIILCQSGVDPDNTVDRGFVQGSYFLVKDNYTYLNMLGPWGLEPQWWPEYWWGAGDAIEDWTDISEIQDSGGCYARHFEQGIVIVNPSDEVRYYTTTKMYSHTIVAEGGLLPEDGIPTGVATGPLIEPGEQEIQPHSTWLGAG